MSSSQPTTQVASAHATERQWGRLKALIRAKYLIHDESLENIAEAIKREPLAEGLNISKQIVERRLKKWGFYKNLSVDNWRHVGNVIDERKQHNKESVVILSGKRLDSREVESKVNRHKPLLEYTAPKVKTPDPAFPLDICTPRATDLDIANVPSHYQPWPENLPWFEFNRDISFEVVPSFTTLTQPAMAKKRRLESSSNTGTLIDSRGKRQKRIKSSHHADSGIARSGHISNFIINHIMNITIGSVELISSFVASRSIDCLAGTLDRVIPESCQDENIGRASLLIRGTYQEQQRELLAILVYLVSNRLIFQPDEGGTLPTDTNHGWLYLLQFFHSTGLANPSALRNLVRLSQRSHSLTGIVDVLFEAAVIENDVEIARILLKEDARLDPNGVVHKVPVLGSKGYLTCPALHASVVQGRMHMTETLIAAGADVDREARVSLALRYLKEQSELSPLVLAVGYLPPDMSAEFVSLLLEKGAKTNTDTHDKQSPLEVAILSTKTKSCKLLRAKGANIHGNLLSKQVKCVYFMPGRIQIPIRWDSSPLEWALTAKTFGILCLAACADGQVDISNRAEYMSSSIGIQANIISTMNVFRDEMKWHVEDEKWFKDLNNAMIVAAGRGHTWVLSFLYHLRAEMFGDEKVIHLCYALLVSIQFCRVEACRLLLSWGAALDTTCPNHENISKDRLLVHGYPFPPPIHLAVLHNSFGLLKVCLEGGLAEDINVPAYIPYEDSDYELETWQNVMLYNTHHTFSHLPEKALLRPVSVAILGRREHMALWLLKVGALYTECDLVYAAGKGLGAVVERLLNCGVSSAAVDKQGRTALDVALSNQKETVAIQLLEAGATARPDLIRFTNIWYFENDTLVQYLLRCYGTIPAVYQGKSYLEWAFLNGTEASIRAALSLDQSAYDCHALCAAIRLEAKHPCPVHMGFLKEMIRRGRMPENIHRVFPTKAVNEAIKHRRLDLLHEIMSAFKAETRGGIIVQNRAYNKENCPATVNNGDHDLLQNTYDEVPGCRPIYFAMKGLKDHDRENMVLALLDSGFPVDTDTLKSAFHETLPAEILDKLIDRCGVAPHNLGFFVKQWYLRFAIERKTPMSVLNKLIDRCDIAAEVDVYGVASLLHAAVQYGNKTLLMSLIDRGAPLSAFDSEGKTPLDSAVESKNLDITRFLLQKGVDPNHHRNKSPLMVAASNGDIGIVKCLLDFGANVNVKRRVYSGFSPGTPLEGAAYSGLLDVTHLLLTRGLDTEHTGRVQFVRAVMFAKQRGYHGVAQILQEHRPWSPEDEELRQEFDRHPCKKNQLFMHPLEYKGRKLRSKIHQWIQTRDEMPCEHCCEDDWWKGDPSTQKILHEEMISVFRKYPPEMYTGCCEFCEPIEWEKSSSIYCWE